MKSILRAILFVTFISAFQTSYAETNTDAQKNIHTDLETLKNEVLELNRDLFVLEEDLLFSANTQINVFLSMNAGKLFHLDSVQLKIDDTVVSNYLYTERELKALSRGGVQRLYIGNLSSGEHEIIAIFTGQGPNDRTFKRATSQKIDKTNEAQFIELKINDNLSKEQAEFSVKVWEQ